jgi:hypothetical protein
MLPIIFRKETASAGIFTAKKGFYSGSVIREFPDLFRAIFFFSKQGFRRSDPEMVSSL